MRLADRMLAARRARIDRPWTFKIEFTRGCNLRCKFCPIHALPEYNEHKEFLSPILCAEIARQANGINPTARIELTMRGEPTLNPHVVANVAAIRRHMPSAQISLFTNGVRLLKEPALMLELLRAGTNILNIDCYNGTYDRFNELAAQHAPGVRCADFRAFSAYKRHANGHRLKVINLVPDIADEARLVQVRAIHNNAGNVDFEQAARWGVVPVTTPLAKRCARPFREMVFAYDGSVLICCHDWRATCVLGRVPAESAESIWYGERHLAILRSLYAKDRSGVPCAACDYSGGHRLGLLRDPG